MTETDGMLEPQAELIASPLRYIELLLFEPLRVVVGDVTTYVAGPAMFVAQKALMCEQHQWAQAGQGPRERVRGPRRMRS